MSAVPTTATPRPVIDTSRLWAHLRVAFRALVATLTALHVAEDLAKRVRYLSDGRTISQLQLVRRGQVFGELELVFGSRRTWWSVWSETRELNLWAPPPCGGFVVCTAVRRVRLSRPPLCN